MSRDPHLVLTTVLGSCIACCLFDPVVCIGGLNHFLLAETPASLQALHGEASRYGRYAMEGLVNAMLKRGATLQTMRAHLYGGANLYPGMRPIGTENAQFARQFLHARGVALAHEDTGGTVARRLDFHPVSGRVRCRMVDDIGPALYEPMMA